MKQKVITTVFICAFMLILVLPTVFLNFDPDRINPYENRYYYSMPKLFNDDRSLNRGFIAEFEQWINDNIGFREEAYSGLSEIVYNLFDSALASKVVAGKDGWMYYVPLDSMRLAEEDVTGIDERGMKNWCMHLEQERQLLENMGAELLYTITPSKLSVYPEYARGNIDGDGRFLGDVVKKYIEENSEVGVEYLRTPVLEAKKNTDYELFYKTDTHWNAEGAYYGYCEMIDYFNRKGIIDTAPVDAEYVYGMRETDLRMINGQLFSKYELYAPNGYSNGAVPVSEGEIYEVITAYGEKYGIYTSVYENEDRSLPKAVIYGDSMFDPLIPLYAKHFSTLVFIWDYNISADIVKAVDPDVVVLEMKERYLTKIIPECSYSAVISGDGMADFFFFANDDYDEVSLPLWTEENGQDDLVYYPAEKHGDGIWHISFDTKDHPGEKYICHAYGKLSGEEQIICAMNFTYYTTGR